MTKWNTHMDKDTLVNYSERVSNPVTHEELLAWINGAGLVNRRQITMTIDGEVQHDLDEDQEEEEELE